MRGKQQLHEKRLSMSFAVAAADQCTHDHEGIGVCVEGLDDGCLLPGSSQLRGFTVTCTSASSK
jgi:hypothetical protein